MDRILVVGGTGFIGSAFVGSLANSDNEFCCLSRTLLKDEKSSYEQIQMDIMCSNYDIREIERFDPTIVVYLAWQDIPDFGLAKSLANLQMSIRFFDKILARCAVKKIIVSGSCWEAGKDKGRIKPDQWLPRNDFTWAKKALFDWLAMRKRSRDFTLVWARLFYVFGKAQRSKSLIPMLCRSILINGVTPELRSSLDRLDYVSVEDVADVLHLMCEYEVPSGVYNVGRGQTILVKDIANFLFSLLEDENACLEITAETNDEKAKVNFCADMEKTLSVLGWQSKSSFSRDLRGVFAHHKSLLKDD